MVTAGRKLFFRTGGIAGGREQHRDQRGFCGRMMRRHASVDGIRTSWIEPVKSTIFGYPTGDSDIGYML